MSNKKITIAAILGLGLCLIWAYGPVLMDMVDAWGREQEYSHGYLVPVFALVLLFLRRQMAENVTFRTSWWGLVLIGVGLASRTAGVYTGIDWFEAISLLPFVGGLVLLLGGWQALRWAWPSVAFLAFMVPLPYRAKVMLANPLQQIATRITTYVMQTVGLPALYEGNTIIINETKVEVAAACSGLAMLMTFFALSLAVALLIKRPLGDRIVVFLSAIPIAVASNVLRIIIATLLYHFVGKGAGDLFHESVLAPLFMMSVALGMMWLELKLISLILIEPEVPSLATSQGPAEAVAAGSSGRRRGAQTAAPTR